MTPSDGYDEDGIWIDAKPKCPVHHCTEPCATCSGYIAGGA